MSEYVILESGGKQYRAGVGATIEVDRLPNQPGEQIELDRVLLFARDGEVRVGTPFVEGVTVRATVLEHFKGPKVITFHYVPKKRIRVKGGHRQQYTRLQIESIEFSEGQAPKKSRKA